MMYSDNGTNFVGTDRVLRDATQSLLSDETIDIILRKSKFHSIEWKFCPSSSPHLEAYGKLEFVQ